MSTTHIPLAFASCSIGLPKHTLHQKIEAIRSAGFQGIELSFPDLLSYASLHFGRDIAEDDYPMLTEAAKAVKELCSRHELAIMVLQPFSNFEGWPAGSPERENAFARAQGWIRIMDTAGIKMLQVGSSDSVGISSSFTDLAADLRELADLLSLHGMKLAYENWCWATRAAKWKDAWDIVKMADRPNIGLCLDTFQTAGGEWGDPTTASGMLPNVSAEDLTRQYMDSLKELTSTVPADKIYFLQLSDAYKMDAPMANQEEDGLRPRGRWSRDWRPLPYDGGYLPITEFTEAVLKTGFRGWVSVEVFDGKFKDKYGDDLMAFAHKAKSATQLLLSMASTACGEAK